MTRVPYADRPEVRAAWCTCPRDDEGEREVWYVNLLDNRGNSYRIGHYLTDPACRLHGANREEAPF